jgi:hypothetical protein
MTSIHEGLRRIDPEEEMSSAAVPKADGPVWPG